MALRQLWLMGLGLAIGGGCVVRYGASEPSVMPAEPQPPPADFAEVEQRLDALLNAASRDDEVDIDRLDRLRAARDLARRMREADAVSQRIVLTYLQRLVEIEERDQPVAAPVLGGKEGGAAGESTLVGPSEVPVHEEDLGGPAPAPKDTDTPPPSGTTPPAQPGGGGGAPSGFDGASPAPASPSAGGSATTAALIEQAEQALRDGRPREAMHLLEPCQGSPCWSEVADTWAKARDTWVHHERERAAAMFLAARSDPDPASRERTYKQVRAILADLADRYPNTRYIGDLRHNIELVQRALDELTDTHSEADGQ